MKRAALSLVLTAAVALHCGFASAQTYPQQADTRDHPGLAWRQL